MIGRPSIMVQSGDNPVAQVTSHELESPANLIPLPNMVGEPVDQGIVSKQEEPHAFGDKELGVSGNGNRCLFLDLLGYRLTLLIEFLLLLL